MGARSSRCSRDARGARRLRARRCRRCSRTSRCSSGVGEATDVVRKEMYDFDDKGGRHIALRPEGTASVVRAFVAAPAADAVEGLVRRARTSATSAPQAGRYRQHHQVGVEVLGVDDPDVDVEVIALARRLLPRRSGCDSVDAAAQLDGRRRRPRRATSRRCARYLGAHADDARRRDRARRSRRTRCGCSTRSAPTTQDGDRRRAAASIDYLSDEAAAHFERCRPGSRALGIAVRDRAPARARPRLLHAHHVRVRRATRSTRRRTRSAAAVATTGWPRRWAGRRRPASASASGIERMLLACDAEGVFAGAGVDASTCSSSTSSAATHARRRSPTSCARAGRPRRPRVRRPLDEGADEGGRPVGRALRA